MTALTLADHQSAETAWRLGARLHDAQHKLERARQEMEDAQREIDWLRAHPPLTYAFNWSA